MTTITALVAAYQAEAFLGETIESILAQTRAADEIVVVDDGSTDNTAAVLASFGDAIRVVRQPNAGCPAAFNTAVRAATGDFVALCGADDVWEPDKLERQAAAIAAHPQVDVLFGDAQLFGLVDGTYARPPGEGVLDAGDLRRALYHENLICAPSIVLRRELFTRLGPFVEDFGADDYEFWMRCLRDGATFYYNPQVLLRYRRHEGNLSSKLLWMQRCSHAVHRWYAEDMDDPQLVRDVLADDLFKIARHLVDEGDPDAARDAFRAALRQRVGVRALAWVGILGLPRGPRERMGDTLVRVSRALEAA